jgi:hypothetical protein
VCVERCGAWQAPGEFCAGLAARAEWRGYWRIHCMFAQKGVRRGNPCSTIGDHHGRSLLSGRFHNKISWLPAG